MDMRNLIMTRLWVNYLGHLRSPDAGIVVQAGPYGVAVLYLVNLRQIDLV